jgi:thioredoxin reductase (NADPH)
MDRPVLFIADADAAEREGLAGALERRFGADYEIATAATGGAALETLERLAAAGRDVALIAAQAWLPGLDGSALIQRAHGLHPGAKRVLLVDVGDMRVMEPLHRGMALGLLDNVLYRPAWRWPEDSLYLLVQEALSAWSRDHRPRFELVRLVGARWSARSHELRDLLTRMMIPFGFHEAGSPEGERILREAGLTAERLPVLVFHTGAALVEPSNIDLAAAMGVRTRPPAGTCDVAIVGAGPAGLAAAVYGSSEGLRTVVVEREAFGGQAGTSSMIRNYPGFPRGISGGELTYRAFEQTLHFGTDYVFASEVTGGSWTGAHHALTLANGSELRARAVVIATGVAYRRLGIPALEALVGAGVFYGAALAEAQAMAGQEVYIVGAGNSAGQAAIHLAKTAATVTLVVRGADLASSMSDYLIREIETKPTIAVRLRARVVDGHGGHRLEGLVLEDADGGRRERVPAAALFIMIGAMPRTDWVGPGVQRDAGGYLLTGRDVDLAGREVPRPPLPLETSVPGVFAVGDVRANSTKRVASAVGEGSVAIRLVHEYLASQGQAIG